MKIPPKIKYINKEGKAIHKEHRMSISPNKCSNPVITVKSFKEG
jgi:hypothetical protein